MNKGNPACHWLWALRPAAVLIGMIAYVGCGNDSPPQPPSDTPTAAVSPPPATPAATAANQAATTTPPGSGTTTVVTTSVATDNGEIGPAPSNPAPSNPAPSNPAPSNPAPSNPAPSNPAPSNPAPANPAPASPMPPSPAPAPPANGEPTGTVAGTISQVCTPAVPWGPQRPPAFGCIVGPIPASGIDLAFYLDSRCPAETGTTTYNVRFVETLGESPAATVTTASDGSYTLTLAPGIYLADSIVSGLLLGPACIRVESGATSNLSM